MTGRNRIAPQPATTIPLPFLAATATLCGALVMVVEVMGSRVIGPFFGVSLFVWTALITVTLVALAAGYTSGGWLADRHGTPDVLYGLILLAGVAVLSVPWLRGPVLAALAPAGIRTGALLSSLVLFGPGLLLLGCVSPFVVRLAAPSLERMGRTVGLFYAVSTIGSFLGTVATGFFLIGHLSVRGIFLLSGSLLVGLAAAWFVGFRRRWAAVALLALPFLVPAEAHFSTKVMDNGTRVTRVHRKEGFYADLQVLDYSYGETHTREMVLDGLIQGGIDMRTGLPVYGFSYVVQQLSWGIRPGGATCLVVGLGPGLIPRWFEERGATCDVVDINPDVVEAARRYFGFAPRGEVHLADARRFLSESKKRYDYVILDVFNGDTTPGHLLTLEAMRLLRGRVAPGGILTVNLIGSVGAEGRMTASVVKTASCVFESVRLYASFDTRKKGTLGNLTLVAQDGPPLRFVRSRVAAFPVHPLARQAVDAFLGHEYAFPAARPALVLTDDFNPIDFFDRELKERLRSDILQGTDWQALL